MRCAECGAPQSDAHRFCSNCGAPLHAPGAEGADTTSQLVLPEAGATGEWSAGAHADGPVLAVRAGGPSGALFPIRPEGTVTIGRSPTADVFLDDVTVSRHHARIEHRPEGIVLRDMGSLNGTYVNRRRIEDEERLEDGDELQIGKFRLTYIAG
jgi:hypothetical protein